MSAVRFLLHGTTLALACFLLLNAAISAVVALVSPRLTKRPGGASPGPWLTLRLLPAALSIAFVAVVFLPSYWKYEPREFAEGFDAALAALALLALAIIGTAIARGVSAQRCAARRTEHWLRASGALTLPGTSMPACVIDTDTDAPGMALVGVLRPRLLITRPVLDALTEEELQAGVAHELGHRRAGDNLKRLAMRAAPDLLSGTPAAHALERRWAAASEHMADRGACGSSRARCALASALVKVARLTPPASAITEPVSALVEGGDITARVQRLLEDRPSAAGSRTIRSVALAMAAAAAGLGYAPLLRLVHDVTEIVVHALP